MQRPLFLSSVLSALCGLTTVGCSVVSDLDRFEVNDDKPAGDDAGGPGDTDAALDGGELDGGGQGDELGCANPRTLCVQMVKFSPHVDNLVTVDLVTEGDNLRARAVLDPFSVDTTAEVVLPLAIPESEVPDEGDDHPLHLEIWADQSEDREYTPDKDHDWNVELPASGNVVFTHNTVFTDLLPRPRSIGGDFHMRFRNMDVHAGQRLEVMVIENDSGRTVGLYRVREVPEDGELEITIPGIIDVGDRGGIVYTVEFYADASQDLSYDDFPTDHTWVLTVESTEDGVDIEFEHGTNFENLDYQFDFEE